MTALYDDFKLPTFIYFIMNNVSSGTLRVAVQGCSHGELDLIYESVRNHGHVDLLICCGDFQAVRNMEDLQVMACPDRYKAMGSFYKYYSGEKVAPVMTIYISGNHDPLSQLFELPYGGWVAPNIYFLGTSGIVNYGGLRIGGISGIFKGYDYFKGYYEFHAPVSEHTIRSSNHLRLFDVWKMDHIRSHMDIMLSHDWPEGIYNYGNVNELLRIKPFFREDMENHRLGSPPAMNLLQNVRPRYWFSGHLHCRFEAVVPHAPRSVDEAPKETHFLALDKPVRGRRYMEVLDIPVNSSNPTFQTRMLCYDIKWLTLLRLSHLNTPTHEHTPALPEPSPVISEAIKATQDRVYRWLRKKHFPEAPDNIISLLPIPTNFSITSPPHNVAFGERFYPHRFPPLRGNPQTDEFLTMLWLPHLMTVKYKPEEQRIIDPPSLCEDSKPLKHGYKGGYGNSSHFMREHNQDSRRDSVRKREREQGFSSQSSLPQSYSLERDGEMFGNEPKQSRIVNMSDENEIDLDESHISDIPAQNSLGGCCQIESLDPNSIDID